jgi:hypothetical protein
LQVELSDKIVRIFLSHAKERHFSNVFLKLTVHADGVIISSRVILDISFTFSFGGLEPSRGLVGQTAHFILHKGVFLFRSVGFTVTYRT